MVINWDAPCSTDGSVPRIVRKITNNGKLHKATLNPGILYVWRGGAYKRCAYVLSCDKHSPIHYGTIIEQATKKTTEEFSQEFEREWDD